MYQYAFIACKLSFCLAVDTQRHALYVQFLKRGKLLTNKIFIKIINNLDWSYLFVPWSIQRPREQIQFSASPITGWHFPYSSYFRPILFTDNFFPDFIFCDYDKEHMAGTIGQLKMLTYPWHLIYLLFFRGQCFLCFYFVFFLWTFLIQYVITTFYAPEVFF